MQYLKVAQAAKKWGLTPRSVQILFEKWNALGAILHGGHGESHASCRQKQVSNKWAQQEKQIKCPAFLQTSRL